ncbi:hypothetical protein KVR01_013174 [Diaporthe batatas]|uniref:uncharacterized protein n=1 Tax=Diaporthe batatas TaxID=748121 RepID=UPI001D03B89C|nr:uncharacterized protein KVR01_013174 [Diaporthe batatas]KAG8156952.1 hypothetical protein KVR01_013174 [Diaporthe batatas]
MSNNQRSEAPTGKQQKQHHRGRPASRPGRPRFRVVRGTTYSAHEQAVLDAGYPWVRTNALVPTWSSPDKDPRGVAVADRLNWHGHHGVNTHLIVEGDLTLMKLKKMFNQNHVSAVTVSSEPGALKELSVAPGEMYAGTSQQACRFVEGHRCLSPASAHRYMTRGTLEWVDKTGKAARRADREYVLRQLAGAVFETKFDFAVMRRVATCTFEDDNQVTRGMSQWFSREWNDPAVQAAKGDLRAAIHPLDADDQEEKRKKGNGRAAGGFDGDVDMDTDDADDEDISARLIKAFSEWLPGHVDEI